MVTDEFIFVHIPKTAGRSICTALDVNFKRDHKTISDYCKELGEDGVRNRFKFTCVRNPWDRSVSWWAFFGNMGFERIPFDQWLKKIGNRPHRIPSQKFPLDQMSFCRSPSHDILMDSFLRFESLETDWPPISNRIGVSETLPSIGKRDRQISIQTREAMLRSKRPELAPMIPTENYRDMYTSQELIDIVARIDSETIQRFGYTFP